MSERASPTRPELPVDRGDFVCSKSKSVLDRLLLLAPIGLVGDGLRRHTYTSGGLTDKHTYMRGRLTDGAPAVGEEEEHARSLTPTLCHFSLSAPLSVRECGKTINLGPAL